MKNKILNIALIGAALMATTSCSDYLETSSVSKTDGDFVFSNMVTARAAMDGAYTEWHGAISSHIFGDGLFYAFDIAGSDIMRHPEAYSKQLPRHQPESFYLNGTVAGTYDPVTYGKEAPSSAYAVLFSVIGKANAITSAIEGMEDFEAMQSQTSASDLSQLYGEAVCLRATAYRELIKYYGDVPYQSVMGQAAVGLAPRDSIYDVIIKDVQKVAPLMRPVGTDNKNNFSSTYAYALIGRLALEAGGYQTRRGDIKYVDGDGNALTFEKLGTENNGATYGRRSDWKELYAIAKEGFKNCLSNLGACAFGEDYSTFFDQLHGDDNGYATESIFEQPFPQGSGGNDPRSYSLGRPSGGGKADNFPCKAYGQGRINPAFYYGMFDPNDVRRDLGCTVTASDGKGYETLIPFTPGSTSKGGGISSNKFDENRQTTTWTANQRKSGINAPYYRISEVYLGYAEACALTGDEATAKQYLGYIRNRAFNGNGNVEAFIQKSGSLFEAIIDERGFEFAGEGDRRWTLIRTGLLPKKVKAIKDLTAAMINGLKTAGFYTFENGNTISNVVYTKMVDPKAMGMKSRLVGACTDKTNPVAFPGWRGQKDWESVDGFTGYGSNTKTNVAIKGLFDKLSAEEIAALEADGYKKQDWGSKIVEYADEYNEYMFYMYDYQKAPIYLFPFSPNAMTTGGFTNGYGFFNN